MRHLIYYTLFEFQLSYNILLYLAVSHFFLQDKLQFHNQGFVFQIMHLYPFFL